MYGTNRLRERLEAGKTAIGCWIHMCSPIGVEVVALAGFDMVVLDHEHGPSDFLNSISLMQAISATPATPIVRVPWNDAVYIKRALDIGARGIIIPSVDDAKQARAAVAACRYPPNGIRGSAYGLVRASDYGFQAEGYVADLPAGLLVMCQIESKTAVGNIEEIAAVEGVDVRSWGRSTCRPAWESWARPGGPSSSKMRTRAKRRSRRPGNGWAVWRWPAIRCRPCVIEATTSSPAFPTSRCCATQQSPTCAPSAADRGGFSATRRRWPVRGPPRLR